MSEFAGDKIQVPIGWIMSNLSKGFLAGLQQKLKHLDIQRSYYPLLLIESGHGNLTQQELANLLACDKVQVVRIIDYLSSNGFVVREKDLKDRRKFKLQITSKAVAIIPDIKAAIQETSKMALSGIMDDKTEELFQLLQIIEKNLSGLK
jgi:MarR family transcriptional regulator, transcriptional regulator for hemolysin